MSAPWENTLPTSVEISGKEYDIRTDYRDILTILSAMNDPELNDREKSVAVMVAFYPDVERIPPECYDESARRCAWFINGGVDEPARKYPKFMDWEQDFQYVVAPINRVMGQEIRSIPYMHWWSFLSAYYEIGDCLFAQIVRIRSLKAKGKMDKDDQRWYRENRELVDFKTRYTSEEEDFINRMMGKK